MPNTNQKIPVVIRIRLMREKMSTNETNNSVGWRLKNDVAKALEAAGIHINVWDVEVVSS